MRNLKRTLSLVLAAMMLISMMVVGASAASKDFTDKDEIQNTEAVNTMVALNVIAGKEDGSYFDPTGTLTRAEMAKIVSYVMNGGVEPNIGTKVVPTYSDIDNHWAEAYIEYCTSMGIINGDGAGKFNPEGTLTASQCAKMFLTAMGYNAEVFGLTGNSWETNTNRYANEAGLYKELGGVSVSAPISRDDACQMAYNAIQAAMMVRNWSQNVTDGSISEHYELALNADGTPYRTLFSEKFGGKIFVGTFDGNYDTGSASAKGEIAVYGRLDTESAGDRYAYLPSDLSLDNIGEEFKILFKDGKGGVDNRPDKNDTIYGIYNTEALTVYSITKADLQDAKTDANDGKIKFGDTLYNLADTVRIYTNYKTANGAYTITSDVNAAVNIINDNDVADANAMRKVSSDTLKMVCNDDGEIAKVYVVTTQTAVVTAITSTTIQLTGEASKKLEDCVNAENLSVGDVVRYAKLYSNTAPTFVFEGKAETVEGVIEAYNTTNHAVRIDGTWYKFNNLNTFTVASADYTAANLTSGDVGDTVRLIMDGGNNYGAYKVITGYNNYAVVTATGSFLGTNSVKVLQADGTTNTYTNVQTVDGGIDFGAIGTTGTVVDNENNNSVLYAYEVRSEGTKIALNRSHYVPNYAGSYASNAVKYSADDMTLTAGSTLIVNSDAAVFLYNTVSDEWRAYTAADLNNFSFSDELEYITNSDGNRVVAMAGHVGSFPTANAKNYSFGYVTGKISTQVNDSPVTELTIWNGTESVALLVDGSATAAKGDFVRFPIVASGAVVNNGDVKVAASGSIDTYSYTYAKAKSYDTANGLLITTTDWVDASGVVQNGTDYSYKLTSDTVIIGVKSADKAGSAVSVPVIYTQVYTKDLNNIVVVYDSSKGYNEVVAIFVDEDNYMR